MSKVARQPTSQSCPIERRDPEARCGKMWTWRAAKGRCGIANRPVCVDCIVARLGRRTEIPVGVGVTLVSGTFVWIRLVGSCVKKWAVAPVSATMGEFVIVFGCCGMFWV